jgi:hypothetical protein
VPESFTVDLPTSGLSIVVDVAWSSRVDDERWMLGGTVVPTEDASAWQGLVDAVA